MDSQDLNDSMMNIIERAEAFLSSHPALSRRPQSHQHQEETHSSDATESNGSSSVRLQSANSSTSSDNGANSSLSSSSLSSAAGSSSSGLTHSSEVHLLSEDSDSSTSTVSYEVNLPDAIPYGRVHPVAAEPEADDSVMLVAATIPTIDLCSPPACDDLSMLSPRSRRNRRRRLAANARIVDCITLDDTVPDRPVEVIPQSTGNERVVARDPSQQAAINPTEQHVKRARSTISTESDAPTKTVICPICFDSIFNKKAASTICGHLFCYTCITHEFAIRKQCPICKRKLARTHIHPIYFN